MWHCSCRHSANKYESKERTDEFGKQKQNPPHHVEETKLPEHDATKGQNETEKVTNPDKPMTVELEHYYAVDYVDKYYIGKVVGQKDDGYFEMKFLKKVGQRSQVTIVGQKETTRTASMKVWCFLGH